MKERPSPSLTVFLPGCDSLAHGTALSSRARLLGFKSKLFLLLVKYLGKFFYLSVIVYSAIKWK